MLTAQCQFLKRLGTAQYKSNPRSYLTSLSLTPDCCLSASQNPCSIPPLEKYMATPWTDTVLCVAHSHRSGARDWWHKNTSVQVRRGPSPMKTSSMPLLRPICCSSPAQYCFCTVTPMQWIFSPHPRFLLAIFITPLTCGARIRKSHIQGLGRIE